MNSPSRRPTATFCSTDCADRADAPIDHCPVGDRWRVHPPDTRLDRDGTSVRESAQDHPAVGTAEFRQGRALGMGH